MPLHFYLCHHPMKLVRGKFMKLKKCRRQSLDGGKDFQKSISGNNILKSVKYDFLIDAGFSHEFFNGYDLHIAVSDFKHSQPRSQILFESSSNSEGFFQSDNGDKNIICIDYVVGKHGVNNVGRNFGDISDKEKPRSLYF